jgi:hypothetical protein
MATHSWTRNRFARTPRSVRNTLACYRPRLEALEERLAPAGASTHTTLASLPVDAQAVVSATLGRDDTTYVASPAAGDAFTLSNPAQQLHALLTPAAALLSSGSDTWSMALAQVGHGDTTEAVGVATVQAQQNRVTYNYGALSQWFVNGPAGLEQGFTLSQAPVGSDGSAPLVVDLRLGGSLHASANATGDALSLSRSDGSTVWTYSGLEVFDASGRSLPTRLAVQSGSHDDLVIQVADVGARYPLTIDPFVQQAKLTVSDGASFDGLAKSVAMSSDGSTVVAGAPGEEVGGHILQGAVYVFVEPSTGWANATTETAKLTASDGRISDYLGSSVAFSSDGSTVVAGEIPNLISNNVQQGAVYVFAKPVTGGWVSTSTFAAKLTNSDGVSDLGRSVGISGDGSTVVAGAAGGAGILGNSNRGAVYVFARPVTGGWVSTSTFAAKLTASDAADNDQVGFSVAISRDGSTVVAGANQDAFNASITGPGALYVFAKPSTGNWVSTSTFTAKLTASDGAAGDELGQSVALSGDGNTVVAGAPGARAVYVFAKPGTGGWVSASTLAAKLTASDGAAGDELGQSVALSSDGSTVVAGAPGARAVYVFEEQPPTLSPASLPNDGTYGSTYSQSITATEPGYTGSFTFGSMGLPSWLTPSSTPSGEMLSGMPPAVGSFTFTITATDSGGVTGSQTYTLTVDPETLTINAVSDSKPYDGTTMSSQTPTVMGTIHNNEVTYLQAFQSKDVLGAGNSVLAVSYSITAAASNDYVVKTNNASGTISAASLDIYATSDSKTYNGITYSSQTPTFQVANEPQNTLYKSDTLSGLSQSFTSPNVLGSNGSTLQVNSGYIINDGNQGKDYSVTLHTASGTITQAQPSLSLVLGAPVVIGTGTPLAASATLGLPGVNETGTITFTLYNPSNVSVYTDVVPAAGNATSSTSLGTSMGSAVPTVAGMYQWAVTYSGDGNNKSASVAQGSTPEVAVGVGATVVGNGPYVLYLVGGSRSNDSVTIQPSGTSSTGSSGIQVNGTMGGIKLNKVIYTQAFTTIYVVGFGGNDTILLAPSLTLAAAISAGNGNDWVGAGAATVTVTLGDGNDTVLLGNGNNTVTLGNGNDTVLLGNGNNVVVTGNGNDFIAAGNGDNLIAAGLGYHTVLVGNGNNILIDGSVTPSQSGDSLRQVLSDWISYVTTGRTEANNPATIGNRLHVTYNTSHANTLLAGSGLDWFWETYSKDTTNRKSGDLLNQQQ